MYIRWIKRGHKNVHAINMTFHDAYLVESYRNEHGEPRQRIVAYLGNVRQLGEELPSIERALFMIRAEHAMERVKDLSSQDREHLLNQLQQYVPPLTSDDMLEGFLNTLRWYHKWWSDHDTAPSREEMWQLIQRASDGLISW